jgi:2-hydroxy-3-keto-5-methylthiopentenyl-1-phosphate phosphatase
VRVGSLLVDFDGTACAADVASELCQRFAPQGWQHYDESVRRGELTPREAIDHQAQLLTGSHEEMLAFVLDSFAIDPGFLAVAAWAEQQQIAVAVVSDGFGFYIEPLLAAAGLPDLPVYANRLVRHPEGWHLEHPHQHAECRSCGTCKVLAISRYRARLGTVAFVGDGESDAYAARCADVVFAKLRLAEICRRDGIDYCEWHRFGNVRERLARGDVPARRVPADCPGQAAGVAKATRTGVGRA